MNKRKDSDWKRLEEVIRTTGHTVNSFARHIGLTRSETLYQIRRGNNRISRNVAERIHTRFPQYSVGWLMFGESTWPHPTQEGDPIVCLPMYRDYAALDFPQKVRPDDYLILPAFAARGAEVAAAYTDDVVNPYLRGAYLLLKRYQGADPILFGNIYLVKFGEIRLIRIVKKHNLDSDLLTLSTIQPSVLPDIDLCMEAVTALWHVVGAVCNLVR